MPFFNIAAKFALFLAFTRKLCYTKISICNFTLDIERLRIIMKITSIPSVQTLLRTALEEDAGGGDIDRKSVV